MKIVNGTSYKDETPDGLIEVLEMSQRTGTRLRLEYGDPATGRLWGDDPLTCRIGKSTGSVKIPLAIRNKRSMGGETVLDHCVVRVSHSNKRNGGVIWECDALRKEM